MKAPLTRRRAMALALSAGTVALSSPGNAAIGSAARALSFENLHTGERLSIAYRHNELYLPDATQRIDHILRDFRTGETHPIDKRLLDLLFELRQALRTQEPFQIISGYRSPKTNAMLANRTDGVARNSLHTLGLAVDIRVPGRALKVVRDAARTLAAGGVGYYPGSDFVHVDVGRVRHW